MNICKQSEEENKQSELVENGYEYKIKELNTRRNH